MTAVQLISFARGAPSLDIIDVSGLSAAAGRAFASDPAGITAYGNSYGYAPLRKWIAEKHAVSADQVLITNGSLQADAFLFDYLVKSGDHVVVEKPTYDRTLLSLRQSGAVVHQSTMDPDGINTAELRRLLESGVRPKLAHVIPNYQNPAGTTLSLQQAARSAGAGQGVRLHHLRRRPLCGHPLPGRATALDAVHGRRRPGGARELVHQDGLPRGPGRVPGRPAGHHRRHRQARHEPLHLGRSGGPGHRPPVLRVR